MTIISDPQELRRRIFGSLSPDAAAVVDRVAAATHPAPLYVVAGALRDAMLGREARDTDLAVEGDAIAIAQRAAGGLRVTAHRRFGTATITTGRHRVDIAMTRTEAYARPGALPKVAPADIETDLRRRDFTVNAMALRVDAQPTLSDPCGGIDDLNARRVRVLHDASFRDDATRIFRAFRYAARLQFEIEPHTRDLIDAGVVYIATIGGERLRRELELMLLDCPPGAALTGCAASGALGAIHKNLQWDARKEIAFASAGLRDLMKDTEIVPFGFALLACDAAPRDVQDIVSRLRLKRHEADAVERIAALRGQRRMLERPQAKPSGVALLLDRYPAPAVAAFAADNAGSIAAEVALRYLREWRHVKPSLNGADVQAMGIGAGLRIAQALQLLRAARLDGTARDRDDERVLVARFAKSIRDSSAMTGTIELSTNGH